MTLKSRRVSETFYNQRRNGKFGPGKTCTGWGCLAILFIVLVPTVFFWFLPDVLLGGEERLDYKSKHLDWIIVGGFFGAIIVISALCCCFCWCCMRRDEKKVKKRTTRDSKKPKTQTLPIDMTYSNLMTPTVEGSPVSSGTATPTEKKTPRKEDTSQKESKKWVVTVTPSPPETRGEDEYSDVDLSDDRSDGDFEE